MFDLICKRSDEVKLRHSKASDKGKRNHIVATTKSIKRTFASECRFLLLLLITIYFATVCDVCFEQTQKTNQTAIESCL